MVPGRVVITVDRGPALGKERFRVQKPVRPEVGDVQIEAPVAPRRNPRESPAIRRQPRLHVDRAIGGQALLATACEIEAP